MCNKLIVSKIDIHQIKDANSPTFQKYFYKNCNHCLKPEFCSAEKLNLNEIKTFYCNFCSRNQIQSTKTIYFTFRAIFGYLYLENYLLKSKISLAQLSQAIQKHIEIGKRNKILYDPQSYFWCIKSDIIDVNWTMVMVEDTLNSFDLPKWLQNYSHGNLMQKFKESFLEYNQNQNSKICIPTLEFSCDNKTEFSSTKNFLPNNFRYR